MTLTLPKLTYAQNALEPHMSRETLKYHYGKHHKSYVDSSNKLIIGTEFQDMNLDDIVKKSSGTIFDNVAQVWNHTFFWQGLSPMPVTPGKRLTDALTREFGSLDKFKKAFTKSATDNFGSGWTWLIQNTDSSLAIVNTINADNPLTVSKKPLLTCDVWEHAYYIDYRNERPNYLKHFWALVNWGFVEKNLN